MFGGMEAVTASRHIYEMLAAATTEAVPPRVQAWTGEVWGPSASPSTLVLRHPGAWRALLLPPSDLAAGEAYLFDDVDLEGDLLAMMRWASGLRSLGARDRLRVLALARTLPRPSGDRRAARPRFRGRLHSVRRDRRVVSHHYDTGNEFFALFLDPQMVYSCAYFLDPTEPLQVAQERKLELVCRKLGLRPGMRFLDVGCGWGALVVHAARHHGVEATGLTVSGEQAQWARKLAAENGVTDRVEILQHDYRHLRGSFDAIASVGMVEHVGLSKLGLYFGRLRDHLAPDGLILNHGIVTRARRRPRGRSFVRTYVFPDGQLHKLEDAIAAAEDAGLEVRDMEALRHNYALTLQRWVANLEANAEAARALADDRTYRIWRLYMAGSAVAFETAAIGVDQLLLAHPGRNWDYGRRRLLAADDALAPH